MGRSEFTCYGQGKTVEEAYRKAREADAYRNGHNGYTGTIASTGGCKLIKVPAGMSPKKFVKLISSNPTKHVRIYSTRRPKDADVSDWAHCYKDSKGNLYSTDDHQIYFQRTDGSKIVDPVQNHNDHEKYSKSEIPGKFYVSLHKYPEIEKLWRDADYMAFAVEVKKGKFFFFGMAMC